MKIKAEHLVAAYLCLFMCIHGYGGKNIFVWICKNEAGSGDGYEGRDEIKKQTQVLGRCLGQ